MKPPYRVFSLFILYSLMVLAGPAQAQPETGPVPASASENQPPAAPKIPQDPCEQKLLSFLQQTAQAADVKPVPDWKSLEEYALADETGTAEVMLCRARAAFLVADQSQKSGKDQEKLYKRARALALKVLRSRPEHENIGDSYKAVSGHLSELDAKDAKAIYWFAISWGHVLDRLSMFTAASQAKDVERLLLRLHEIAPLAEGGGGEVFLASYYASLPKFFGKDMEKARRFGEEAAGSPDLNKCDAGVLQEIIGDRLSPDARQRLRSARAQPVDRGRPYALENLICQ